MPQTERPVRVGLTHSMAQSPAGATKQEGRLADQYNTCIAAPDDEPGKQRTLDAHSLLAKWQAYA